MRVKNYSDKFISRSLGRICSLLQEGILVGIILLSLVSFFLTTITKIIIYNYNYYFEVLCRKIQFFPFFSLLHFRDFSLCISLMHSYFHLASKDPANECRRARTGLVMRVCYWPVIFNSWCLLSARHLQQCTYFQFHIFLKIHEFVLFLHKFFFYASGIEQFRFKGLCALQIRRVCLQRK